MSGSAAAAPSTTPASRRISKWTPFWPWPWGGNALSGGKFNIYGSILGAYVIQFLTTTLYKYEVPSTALPAYKAVVVILLVVLSAPVVQEKLAGIRKAPAKTAKEVS